MENINASLVFLSTLGIGMDGFTAKDVKDGNLKAVLSLFFALSRYALPPVHGLIIWASFL